MDAVALLLADSRFPSGSYAHSLGLEQAVSDGLTDVPAFIAARQRLVAEPDARFAVEARRGNVLEREWCARTPSFALRDAPGHLLRRCHQRSEELFTEAVGRDGPTRQQIALLVTVCQHLDASQARLVSLTGIDKNTLTQMIARLADRGILGQPFGLIGFDFRFNLDIERLFRVERLL